MVCQPLPALQLLLLTKPLRHINDRPASPIQLIVPALPIDSPLSRPPGAVHFSLPERRLNAERQAMGHPRAKASPESSFIVFRRGLFGDCARRFPVGWQDQPEPYRNVRRIGGDLYIGLVPWLRSVAGNPEPGRDVMLAAPSTSPGD